MRGARPPRIGAVVAALGLLVAAAAPGHADEAAVAIIIDDLGEHRDRGLRAVRLPGAVTCAFLPHRAHTRDLARRAHGHHKEVMVHLPMQSVEPRRLGPGALMLDMTSRLLGETLRANLDAVPHARGVNNHMGSLLTRHPGHMRWVMERLRGREPGLYFVDSRTTASTVAQRIAAEHGVPNARRHVFLDYRRDAAVVRSQLDVLATEARERGTAVAIAHPYPETLEVLEAELPRLASRGLRLVPVSRLIALEREGDAPMTTVGSAAGR